MADLEDHVMPIRSGLTPTAGGRLSKERTEALSAALDGLRVARQHAAVEIRNYPVTAPSNEGDNQSRRVISVPDPTTPLDLEAIRRRYETAQDIALKAAGMQPPTFDEAWVWWMSTADVQPLLAALAEAQRERDELLVALAGMAPSSIGPMAALAAAKVDIRRMLPVVEILRQLRALDRRVPDEMPLLAEAVCSLTDDEEARSLVFALVAAVDTYETQTGGTE